MPPGPREGRLGQLLDLRDEAVEELQAKLIVQAPRPWSPGLSRAVLGLLRARTAQEYRGWHLLSRVKEFAGRIAPEVLPEALTGWPSNTPGWEVWSKSMDQFLAVVQFRADLHAAFKIEP